MLDGMRWVSVIVCAGLTGCHVLSGIDEFGVDAGAAGGMGGGASSTISSTDGSGAGGAGATSGVGGTGGVGGLELPSCYVGPREDFAGMQQPIGWGEWVEPVVGTSSVTLSYGGTMVVDLPGGPHAATLGRGLFSLHGRTGGDAGDIADCAFVVEVVRAHPVDGVTIGLGTDHTVPTGEELRLNIRIIDDQVSPNYVQAGGSVQGPPVRYDPEVHRWFAIYGRRGDAVFAASPDGEVWHPLWRTPMPFTTAVRSVNVGAATKGDAPAGTVVFDNVNRPP